MEKKYQSPKDYLDAANNPATTASELGILARAPYPFVKLAVVAHPNVTPRILRMCVPTELKTAGEIELVAALTKHVQTPTDVLKDVAQLILSQSPSGALFDIAMALCCNPNAHEKDIIAIVRSKHANSKFRNELGKRTNNTAVKYLLEKIKEENKQNTPASTSANQPVPSTTSAPANAASTSMYMPDERLVGSWTWSSASSSPIGFSTLSSVSISVHETYIFMRDGRFMRKSHRFASQSNVTNAGVLSQQMAFAQTEPGERGRWRTAGRMLYLDWDDGAGSEIDYFIAHDTLEMRFSSGARYYLKN
jgi:hypothetical protein